MKLFLLALALSVPFIASTAIAQNDPVEVPYQSSVIFQTLQGEPIYPGYVRVPRHLSAQCVKEGDTFHCCDPQLVDTFSYGFTLYFLFEEEDGEQILLASLNNVPPDSGWIPVVDQVKLRWANGLLQPAVNSQLTYMVPPDYIMDLRDLVDIMREKLNENDSRWLDYYGIVLEGNDPAANLYAADVLNQHSQYEYSVDLYDISSIEESYLNLAKKSQAYFTYAQAAEGSGDPETAKLAYLEALTSWSYNDEAYACAVTLLQDEYGETTLSEIEPRAQLDADLIEELKELGLRETEVAVP